MCNCVCVCVYQCMCNCVCVCVYQCICNCVYVYERGKQRQRKRVCAWPGIAKWSTQVVVVGGETFITSRRNTDIECTQRRCTPSYRQRERAQTRASSEAFVPDATITRITIYTERLDEHKRSHVCMFVCPYSHACSLSFSLFFFSLSFSLLSFSLSAFLSLSFLSLSSLFLSFSLSSSPECV